MPKVESNRTDTPYPLRDFAGPDSLPTAPEGVTGIDLVGPWRITDIAHVGGEARLDHLFQNGWFVLANDSKVTRVQGVPPEWLLPAGLDWNLNRVDDSGMALGFGFRTPRGNLDFLHYAFVAAPVDVNHVRGLEAVHFKDTRTGLISWSLWSVELERLQQPPVTEVEPIPPSWPL